MSCNIKILASNGGHLAIAATNCCSLNTFVMKATTISIAWLLLSRLHHRSQITDHLIHVCSLLGWGSSHNLHLRDNLGPLEERGATESGCRLPFPWRRKELGRGPIQKSVLLLSEKCYEIFFQTVPHTAVWTAFSPLCSLELKIILEKLTRYQHFRAPQVAPERTYPL
mmetsp:Transcript_114009/g.213566  ORF Transcript_114009/g.213566 Transcript_114009/m.213566 type:complete len:168 (-) Transcript_114009:40-543(-)